MKDFSEYKLSLLKLISSLKILELQKNEIRNHINRNLNKKNYKEIIKGRNPADYLNHILKAYGKNNYTIHIFLSSFMNLLIFNLVYIGMLAYNNWNLANLNINLLIEFTIFMITMIIFPLLKITVRTGLIENKKGSTIIKKISVIIFISFGMNLLFYKIGLLTNNIVTINSRFILPIIALLIVILQIFFKLFKYDTID